MKQPKTFKYPRLYYQPGAHLEDGRLRIIHPNGKCEWFNPYHNIYFLPCWSSMVSTLSRCEPFQHLRAMRWYDKNKGFKKAWFLGEIK